MTNTTTALFGLFALILSVTVNAENRQTKIVEIVSFTQIEGTNDSDVAQAMNDFSPHMNKYGTLLFRSVSKGANGSWTMMNYWRNKDAMDAFNSDVQNMPEFGEVAKYIDFNSLDVTTLDVLGFSYFVE